MEARIQQAEEEKHPLPFKGNFLQSVFGRRGRDEKDEGRTFFPFRYLSHFCQQLINLSHRGERAWFPDIIYRMGRKEVRTPDFILRDTSLLTYCIPSQHCTLYIVHCF